MEIPVLVSKAAEKLSEIKAETGNLPFLSGDEIDTEYAQTTNLASSALNSTVLACSNDYFAAASNLLTPTAPIHRPGVFVHTGAWYDGWETRRHNPNPYDWVVIKLGVASGVIHAVEIDTAYFVGNYGEKAALQGVYAPSGSGISDEDLVDPDFKGWKTILTPQPCGPSQRRAWKVWHPTTSSTRGGAATTVPTPYTHVRLLMYPDGGFARLRLYGHAIPPALPPQTALLAPGEGGTEQQQKPLSPLLPVEELSSALLGGVALGASDQHYTPCSNLLLPGRGKDMGDGWETARSRAQGHVDWAIVKLGLPGSICKVVVDTKDFRGNFPRAVRVHGFVAESETGTKTAEAEGAANSNPSHDHPGWIEVVRGEKACQADTEHVFEGADLAAGGGEDTRAFTHVKLTLVPDGGVKRFRVFGHRAVIN